MYTGVPFVPACKAHICDHNVTSGVVRYVSRGDATRDGSLQFAEPTCTANSQQVKDWATEERITNNQQFIPAALALTGAAIAATYCLMGGDQHALAWLGVGLRVFDFMTDWATYAINIKGSLFAHAYGDQNNDTEDANVQSVIAASLAFCILGSLLTPLDVWGATKRAKDTDASGVYAIIIATLALEDVPQLILNIIFIRAVKQNTELAVDAIAVLSLIASSVNIVWNLGVLRAARNKGNKGSMVPPNA
jgi:hypothetical protein